MYFNIDVRSLNLISQKEPLNPFIVGSAPRNRMLLPIITAPTGAQNILGGGESFMFRI